jgi:hypothetical protein
MIADSYCDRFDRNPKNRLNTGGHPRGFDCDRQGDLIVADAFWPTLFKEYAHERHR